MKCKDCSSCICLDYMGGSTHYCYGIKEPFKIYNLESECTEYPKKYWENTNQNKLMEFTENTSIKKDNGLERIMNKIMNKQVEHPSYYGGENNPYEAIKVIEAWDLGFNLGNVVKYISRCGKKDLKNDILKSKIEDLEKAQFYLNREVMNLKNELETIEYQD